ncbi:hypothetical protein HOLleu_28511 [Holothuria leucospilota]|uniref:Uncharacterized protein n=1 Tax=Holothuria leucospilota TaxID=206669 RepID=A0A9Q1H205_HOLLE|nr:hypothetical protein HOLleu_28511 [Holothuria leucospilota]
MLASLKRTNIFFGSFSALTPSTACDSLRIKTDEANLENPELIKSTKLRKYTATLSQVSNLQDNHYQWLADHLGHTCKTFKAMIKKGSLLGKEAKIAKLLLATDAGEASSCMGKTLDEISFEEIPSAFSEVNEPVASNTAQSTESKKQSKKQHQSTSGGTGIKETPKHGQRKVKAKAWCPEDNQILI